MADENKEKHYEGFISPTRLKSVENQLTVTVEEAPAVPEKSPMMDGMKFDTMSLEGMKADIIVPDTTLNPLLGLDISVADEGSPLYFPTLSTKPLPSLDPSTNNNKESDNYSDSSSDAVAEKIISPVGDYDAKRSTSPYSFSDESPQAVEQFYKLPSEQIKGSPEPPPQEHERPRKGSQPTLYNNSYDDVNGYFGPPGGGRQNRTHSVPDGRMTSVPIALPANSSPPPSRQSTVVLSFQPQPHPEIPGAFINPHNGNIMRPVFPTSQPPPGSGSGLIPIPAPGQPIVQPGQPMMSQPMQPMQPIQPMQSMPRPMMPLEPVVSGPPPIVIHSGPPPPNAIPVQIPPQQAVKIQQQPPPQIVDQQMKHMSINTQPTEYKAPFKDDDAASDSSFETDDDSHRRLSMSIDPSQVSQASGSSDQLPIPTFRTLKRKNTAKKSKLASGVSHSLQKNIEVYRASAKNSSDPDIQMEFAKFCIESSNQLENDKERAKLLEEGFSWLKKLSSAGFTEAQFYLGSAYIDDEQFERAYVQFSLAAKKLHPGACFYAAIGLETGTGVKKDLRGALQLFKKAAAAGYKPAMFKLGMASLKGELGLKVKIHEAIKWFKRAAAVADSDNPEALYQLHIIFAKGYPNEKITKDEGYSRSVLLEAANLHYPPALNKVGECLQKGSLGFDLNVDEACRFFNEAASKGNAEAMFSLSGYYLAGTAPTVHKDTSEAFRLAKKAADLDLPRAQFAMGMFYEQGIAVQPDKTISTKWYEKAAKNGDQKAANKLGKKLKRGGTTTNSAIKKDSGCNVM